MQTIDNVNIKQKEMKKENAKNHKYISFKKVRYEKNEEIRCDEKTTKHDRTDGGKNRSNMMPQIMKRRVCKKRKMKWDEKNYKKK